MKVRIFRKCVFFSLLAVFSPLVTWAAGPPDTPIQVVLTPKTWTTVPLPATALGVTEQNGVLWVSGADEMLARSDDRGHTWKVVHFKKDGELLFAMAFAGKDGWAMGSQGMELHSDDDGAHWKRMGNSLANVVRLVAADSRHLIASSPRSFLVSSDGGKSWVVKALPISKMSPPRMYPVQAIAMPDAEHAMALLGTLPAALTAEDPEAIFVSTSDGGKTWNVRQFSAGIHIDSLNSDANGYMAPGFRKLGNSYKVVAFHSADGTHWSEAPNKPEVYRCHRSACQLSGAPAWVVWDHGVATYWKTSSMPEMANHWAVIPGVVCAVGNDLQCTLAQRLAAAPPEPATLKADDQSRVKPQNEIKAANCLRCAPPKYPQPDRQRRISGEVDLHAVIDKSGRVKNLTLRAAPSWSLAQAAIDAVKGWIYNPTLLNGKPVEVDTEIVVNYTLTR